jgi:hypothetical protein
VSAIFALHRAHDLTVLTVCQHPAVLNRRFLIPSVTVLVCCLFVNCGCSLFGCHGNLYVTTLLEFHVVTVFIS